MARTFDGGNYLSQSSALVAAAPMTFACWINFASGITTNAAVMGITSSAATHQSYYSMSLLGSSSKMSCSISNDAGSTTDFTAASSQVISVSTWYHVACVFASTTSRTCYVNGANSVSSAVSVSPGTCNSTTIGALSLDGLISAGPKGTIAFPAFWSVALTAADVLSLSKGFGPARTHRTGLVGYARLTGGNSPEPDMVSATGWTLVSG